jgi:hypothetical protein
MLECEWVLIPIQFVPSKSLVESLNSNITWKKDKLAYSTLRMNIWSLQTIYKLVYIMDLTRKMGMGVASPEQQYGLLIYMFWIIE